MPPGPKVSACAASSKVSELSHQHAVHYAEGAHVVAQDANTPQQHLQQNNAFS